MASARPSYAVVAFGIFTVGKWPLCMFKLYSNVGMRIGLRNYTCDSTVASSSSNLIRFTVAAGATLPQHVFINARPVDNGNHINLQASNFGFGFIIGLVACVYVLFGFIVNSSCACDLIRNAVINVLSNKLTNNHKLRFNLWPTAVLHVTVFASTSKCTHTHTIQY